MKQQERRTNRVRGEEAGGGRRRGARDEGRAGVGDKATQRKRDLTHCKVRDDNRLTSALSSPRFQQLVGNAINIRNYATSPPTPCPTSLALPTYPVAPLPRLLSSSCRRTGDLTR